MGSDLEKPGESIEEGGDAFLVLNLVIAYDQPRDVYGQVAISLHQLGDREDKEYTG